MRHSLWDVCDLNFLFALQSTMATKNLLTLGVYSFQILSQLNISNSYENVLSRIKSLSIDYNHFKYS